MKTTTLLLLVSGILVFGAIGYLFVEVRASAAPVPAKQLDEAREKAKVGQRARQTAPSSANLDDPWSATKVEPVVDTKGGPVTVAEAEPTEPEPQPAPEYRPATPGEAATPNLDGDPKLEVSNAKDEANRLYDKQDYEGALSTAMKILDKEPGDIRMLRVATSSACQLGDAPKAKEFYAQLPPHDQSQMARRCSRMNITFE